jgi:hypothetical protein
VSAANNGARDREFEAARFSMYQIPSNSEEVKEQYVAHADKHRLEIKYFRASMLEISRETRTQRAQQLTAMKPRQNAMALRELFDSSTAPVRRQILCAIVDRIEIDPSTRSFQVFVHVDRTEAQKLLPTPRLAV